MRARLATIVLSLLAAASADAAGGFAGGFGRVDEPDCLDRVDDHDRVSNLYHRRVERLLRVPGWTEAAAVCRPSFDAEESIAIHRVTGDPSRYVMTHARASGNIWYARERQNIFYTLRDRNPKRSPKWQRIMVSRHDVPLPTDLGRRICGLWERLLREAYSLASPIGRAFDGTTYELHRHYLRAEAYDPANTMTQSLVVSLVDALLTYGRAGYAKRPAALKAVETKCRALEDHLAKCPPLVPLKLKPIPQPIPAAPAEGRNGISGLDVIPARSRAS